MTDYFKPPRDLPSGSTVWMYLRDSGGASQENSVAQQEREHAQVKAEIERLESQLAASKVEITPEAMTIVLDTWRDQLMQARATKDIRFVRAWLYRFVSRIELGYNRARIYYTYPMADLSLTPRFGYPLRGGTSLFALFSDKPVVIEWSK